MLVKSGAVVCTELPLVRRDARLSARSFVYTGRVTKPASPPPLAALRDGLLAVHKALLDLTRAGYEREHGPVGGPGALLQLLLNDDAFAWLRPVSTLAARADELLEEDDVAEAERSAIAVTAGELLTPEEHGTGFGKRYFDAIQSAPDVAMAHADVRRAVSALAPARRA
jgi:hypothetical protein